MQEEKQEEEGEEKPSKKNKQKGGPEEKQKEQKNASTEEKVWDPLALWWEGEEAAGGWQVAFHKGLYSKQVNEFRHLICKLLNCKKEEGVEKGGANWRGMAYGSLHFHYHGKGRLMNIEDNCEDEFGLIPTELPFDAVQEVRNWQEVTQEESKQEWDDLREWAKSFKAWTLEKKKPDLEGGVHAKDTSGDRSAYPYPAAENSRPWIGIS